MIDTNPFIYSHPLSPEEVSMSAPVQRGAAAPEGAAARSLL